MMRGAMLLLLAATATAVGTPVQRAVMERLRSRAKAASEAATASVLQTFNDPEFRRQLKQALSPASVTTLDPTVPAHELLRRYRAEVAVAEVVHSFSDSPFNTQMSVRQARNATAARNLWQFQLLASAANRTAAEQVADHQGFGGMNAAEVGLFGFPAFTGSRPHDPLWSAGAWPKNLAEAADRPIYSTLNLRKVDGGNDIFGPVGLVFRQSTMAANRTILTPVDTGCYEYLCNSSWAEEFCSKLGRAGSADFCDRGWSGKQCSWDAAAKVCRVNITLPVANCSQWGGGLLGDVGASFAGTPVHFDHLIVPAARWWNGSVPTTWRENLVGQMARMFRRWPQATNTSGGCWSSPGFTPATSVENFWEAEVLAPQFGGSRSDDRLQHQNQNQQLGRGLGKAHGDVKLVLGLFGALYGTQAGSELREWCDERGWALVWAFGPVVQGKCEGAVDRSNQRLLDPHSSGGAGANLSTVPGQPAAAAKAAAEAWAALAAERKNASDAGAPLGEAALRRVWLRLRTALPPRYLVEPLYGLSCADVDCVGVVQGSGDCVCYGA